MSMMDLWCVAVTSWPIDGKADAFEIRLVNLARGGERDLPYIVKQHPFCYFLEVQEFNGSTQLPGKIPNFLVKQRGKWCGRKRMGLKARSQILAQFCSPLAVWPGQLALLLGLAFSIYKWSYIEDVWVSKWVSKKSCIIWKSLTDGIWCAGGTQLS